MQQSVEVPTPRALADLVARCEQINRFETQLTAVKESRGASCSARRQHILVRCLLEKGFDFSSTLDDSALVAVSGASALKRLSLLRLGWALCTYAMVEPWMIDGKMVLVRRRRLLPRGMWGGRR